MKDKGSRIDKRKSKQVCLAMVLVFAAMVFCHSCTPPEAVYAAESDEPDSVQQMVIKGPVARAGSILNFSNVNGTIVPKIDAKSTTASNDRDTAIVMS